MAVTRYLMKLLVLMLIAVALRLPSNMVKGDEVHGFPLVPGLRHVCGRHITGVSGQPSRRTEITWEAFATDATVGEIVAQYRRKLGEAGMEGDEHGATWRFPVGTTKPKRLLEVSASTKDGPWRDCDRALLAKAQCIVLVSEIAPAD
jgi:hypothetical protein